VGWRQRVAIVGSGFAGIAAARAFRNQPVEVLLVDRTNHHLFQPLLYQVATCALSPAEIAMPIRHVCGRQKYVEVVFTEVTDVNLKSRSLQTKYGPIEYHFLI
jgi:NADH dehydrogenase